MSLKVVELNDRAITVSDEGGVILQSPGFALVDGDVVHVGETAEQQARLNPTQSYNKYWQELNLEPISHGNNFRHYADIAYAHLLNLAETAGLDGDVVFAVPGNFNRQQLGILLGLCQQCPFDVVGVVDSALASASQQTSAQPIIVADIQLHQAVLTPVTSNGDSLEVGTAIQIPGVGSQNFMDLMMRMATDMFIQQCRFNPQHNAVSEQQLYNALPDWLSEVDDGNLILELKAGETLHTAKMPRDSLIASLSGHFKKINEQISALAGENACLLVMTEALAAIPGFQSSATFSSAIIKSNDVHDAVLHHRHLITESPEAIQLVRKLPLSEETKDAVLNGNTSSLAPTHALLGNRAFPVSGARVSNQPGLNGSAANSSEMVLSIEGLPETLGTMELQQDRVLFNSGELEFSLNDHSVSGKQELSLGDEIRFEGSQQTITLIQVENS